MTKEPRRKPDGTITTVVREYYKAWHAVAAPIEKATNSKMFGFNPGFLFYRLDNRQSSWTMETPEAIIFSKALTELEQLKKDK